jgi:anti-anti-sigma factor
MPEPHYRLLHVNTEDDVLVLTIAVEQVEGDSVSLDLQRELLAAAASSGLSRVIVDFQNVRYISSVAFSPLLALRRHLTAVQGRMLVCGLSTLVGDIFYTTKMVDPTGKFRAPFEMRPDVPTALAAIKAPAPSPTETSGE